LNALELRAIAYLIAAICFGCLGAYLAGLHYKAIIAEGDARVANVAAQAAVAAKAQQDVADAHNREVVSGLQTQLDAAVASGADFAKRLRDAEARSRVVSQGADRPAAPATGQQDGTDRLTDLLGAAAAECLINEARQDALIEELKPQL